VSFTLLHPIDAPAEPVPSFSEASLAYAEALSGLLMRDASVRAWPDLVALGFWLRRANLSALLEPYRAEPVFYKPVGHVFHNAPANVDSLFVYSGMLSFLAGNVNWIRLSSRAGGSAEVLVAKLGELAVHMPRESARFRLFTSTHESPELAALVARVDARVLWGSDEAIAAQRRMAVPAHARDVCFAHKFSAALLGASAAATATPGELATLARLFARDNLTYAQQACSSAKAVVWLGDAAEVERARLRFWEAVAAEAVAKASLGPSDRYQALANAQQIVLETEGVVRLQGTPPLERLEVPSLTAAHAALHQGCGLFVETRVESLVELTPQLSASHQTLAHWGVPAAELEAWFRTVVVGVDRLVPVGEALSFAPLWDGMDLVRQLTRQIAR
jgi:hypothetical protein